MPLFADTNHKHAKAQRHAEPIQLTKGLKVASRTLVFVGLAADAYQIKTAENKKKEITVVAGGWAGAKIGARAVGGLFATIALGAGQAGPQVAAPEEIATVPVAGLVGGLIGGIGGYFTGCAVTKTVYEQVIEDGWALD